MALHTAPAATPTDNTDGKALAWRFCSASFATTDEIRFPVPFRDATLELVEMADPAAPTVTTFTPAIGYATGLDVDGPNRRTVATAAAIAAKSQQKVNLWLRDGYLYLRPNASALCASGIQFAAIVREGSRG